MKDTLCSAKIKLTDFAKLLRVSRVAVSLWCNGHTEPHRMVARRVEVYLKAIAEAVKAGDLPLKPDTPYADRYSKMSAIVHKHIANLGVEIAAL